MSHVADDTAIFHLVHVIPGNDVLITGGGDDNVHVSDQFVQFHNSETVHAETNQ